MCAMTLRDNYLGIIEGFFGSSWSWKERAGYASFLASQGYSFYVYAPKEDAFFRKRWKDPLPDALFQSLKGLSDTCRAQKVHFGVGLSPYEAYRDYDGNSRKLLQEKVKELNSLLISYVCFSTTCAGISLIWLKPRFEYWVISGRFQQRLGLFFVPLIIVMTRLSRDALGRCRQVTWSI